MMEDPDLLEGSLAMLESLKDVTAATFIDSLLKLKLSGSANQLVRKSLYHLKLQGITPPVEEPIRPKAEKEFLYLGENRIALWQPVMLFRYVSSISDVSDLYMIRILEGRDVSSISQQRGLRMERASLVKLAHDYTLHLQQEIGVRIPFCPVPVSRGLYFLQKSMDLLKDQEHIGRLKEFVHLIGNEPSDPEELADEQNTLNPVSVLDAEYFQQWSFDPGEFKEHLEELEKLQEGPIILTDQQVQEMSQGATTAALTRHLEGPAAAIWSLAFEKAAYFLKESDPENSKKAKRLASSFLEASNPDRLEASRILIGRMIALIRQKKQAEKEEEKKSSVIVSPEEFSRRYPQR
jgi:hypothetical protein